MPREKPVVGTCRYCETKIAWAQDANGRNIPMDSKPVPDGEYIVDRDPARPGRFLATPFNREDTAHLMASKRWRSHLKTCKAPKQRTVEHCQAPGCKEPVRREEVVCAGHWGRLPPSLRAELRKHYRERPGGREHAAAFQKAIDWLNGRGEAADA